MPDSPLVRKYLELSNDLALDSTRAAGDGRPRRRAGGGAAPGAVPRCDAEAGRGRGREAAVAAVAERDGAGGAAERQLVQAQARALSPLPPPPSLSPPFPAPRPPFTTPLPLPRGEQGDPPQATHRALRSARARAVRRRRHQPRPRRPGVWPPLPSLSPMPHPMSTSPPSAPTPSRLRRIELNRLSEAPLDAQRASEARRRSDCLQEHRDAMANEKGERADALAEPPTWRASSRR